MEPLEQDVDEPRVLVMEYTARYQYRVDVRPGMGGVSRAIEDAVRCITGQPNIDPASVSFRYRVEDQAPHNATPYGRGFAR